MRNTCEKWAGNLLPNRGLGSVRLWTLVAVLTLAAGCGIKTGGDRNVEAAAQATPTASPQKVSANGRYLVDQNNGPFLIVGDSPQALIGDLSEATAANYLADRQAHGFNAVWINLLCNSNTGCK